MFRHEAMPRLSPRVLLRFRLSSPSATARGKSPCTRARIPAPLSAFTRAELSIPAPLVRADSNHSRPSVKYPRTSQKCHTAPARRSPYSGFGSVVLHQSSAARMLSCSASRRASHDSNAGPCSSGSAFSANCRYQSRCRWRTVSSSPAATRFARAYSRTAPPRHKTLRAALDWSYDLLADEERMLLRRLSVFAGGWTLAAAEAVCAGDGCEPSAVFDILIRLVDRSLVIVENLDGRGTWYRLLEP